LTFTDEGVLPVVGAALATAKGTSSIGSTGGAKKATTATPKALENEAYNEAGSRHERPLQSKAWHRAKTPLREGEQVFNKPERKRLSEGHPQAEDAEGGTCQDTERKHRVRTHPLENAVKGTHQDME